MAELYEYGYWGLFLASFLAATVLPLSSEVVLSLLIVNNYDYAACIAIASIGNWMGGMSSYFLGYLGKIEWVEKYLKIKADKITKTKLYLNKRGSLMAFFCWLPIVGDLIAVALGFLRTNIYLTAISMFVGKFLRYLVWGYLTFEANQHLF